MKHGVISTITSLLSILFLTIHLADDVARGMAPGGLSILVGVLISVVWLYGTLALAERRSGYLITLLGSLLVLVIPVVHLKGVGAVAKSSGGFFFTWVLLALGVTATFSLILSARGLWSLRRVQPR